MNPARQQALSQPPPRSEADGASGSKRQKLSKHERKLAEDEERDAKWESYRAAKRVERGQLVLQPGSFPLFRPPLPPAKPAQANGGSGSGSGSGAGSKWLSEGEKLALHRSLSYPPGSVPPPSEAFLALLDAEVAAFVQSVALADEERLRKAEVLSRIAGALQPLWPAVEVQPFGSFPLDLSLPHSDVDAVLLIQTRRDTAAELRDVQTVLTCLPHEQMPLFKLVARARVPILRYTDVDRGVKVDLCVNATDGVRAVALMRQYMARHSEMRSLVLCLKLLMRRAGVSEVYSGGVNSYILQLMTVFFLQMYDMAADGSPPHQPRPEVDEQEQRVEERKQADEQAGEEESDRKARKKRKRDKRAAEAEVQSDERREQKQQPQHEESGVSEAAVSSGSVSGGRVGMLLYSFLDFYGHRFDYVNYGIQLGAAPSPELPGGRACQYYSKLERGRLSADNPFLLSIEDPLDASRDCGAGSFGILRVQRCLQLAQERLALMAAEWQHTGSIAPLLGSSNSQHAAQLAADEEEGGPAPIADEDEEAAEQREAEGGSELSKAERKRLRRRRKEEKKLKRDAKKAAAAADGARAEEERRLKLEQRMQLGPILSQLATADMYVTPALAAREEERKQSALSPPPTAAAAAPQPSGQAEKRKSEKQDGSANERHSEASESSSAKRKQASGGKAGERVTKKQKRQQREAEAHARNVLRDSNGTANAMEKDETQSTPKALNKSKRKKDKHSAAQA